MLAVLASLFCGVGKSGLAGLGLLNVLIMAHLFPGPASSGVVLPMLVAADVLAVCVIGRRDVDWREIARVGLPMLLGIIAGWWLMPFIRKEMFSRLVGWMVLGMVALHLGRQLAPRFDELLPRSRLFAWAVGLLGGLATMIANAAGPLSVIYFLILGFTKKEFVATMAWLFLILNILKLPFSAQQGLIQATSLGFNALLVPGIAAGFFLGRWAVASIPQKPFERVVMVLTVITALKLVVS